jgi:hypothetical protein
MSAPKHAAEMPGSPGPISPLPKPVFTIAQHVHNEWIAP